MVRTVGKKKIPIGSNTQKMSGEIIFYDVGQRKKIGIDRSKITSEKLPNGKYKLTTKSPHLTKAGKEYKIHAFSSLPA